MVLPKQGTKGILTTWNSVGLRIVRIDWPSSVLTSTLEKVNDFQAENATREFLVVLEMVHISLESLEGLDLGILVR